MEKRDARLLSSEAQAQWHSLKGVVDLLPLQIEIQIEIEVEKFTS